MTPYSMAVLIIEEDRQAAKDIYNYLAQHNCLCKIANSIADAKRMIENENFDCIILDIDISSDAGTIFLKDLRREMKIEGVITLSRNTSPESAIIALNLGADDYLAKPIHLGELSARIEAIMRRKYLNDKEQIVFKNLKMNTLSRTVTVDDNKVNLTKTEYELLLLLIINKGRVISKEEIAARLSGQSAVYFYNFDILYTHLKNLKRKLLSSGQYIKTVYATGYIFSDEDI